SYSTGLQGSQELLLDIEHFLEGQGLLKELDVEELFAALDQACLLETFHLDIAFQMTQALLLSLCFVNSNTSKSSKTAANDSDVETPEAIPKDDDVSSAIATTLQFN
ncbi:hypothetical protein H0H87_011901, partial [Tephrocybe sp. NHM501043]